MSAGGWRWEYRVITVLQEETEGRTKAGTTQATLNELGADGWELVTVMEPEGAWPVAFLKRPAVRQ